MRGWRGTAVLRWVGAALVTGSLVLLAVGPAIAHGDEEGGVSRDFVLAGLSYLANQPEGYMEAAADKIGDALEAEDVTGVQLPKVRAAQRALEDGDMMEARALLQASIGRTSTVPTGDDPGTTTVLDPLVGRTSWGASTAWFTAVSAAAIVAGLVLAWLWRPEMSLRALRARSGRAQPTSRAPSEEGGHP